VGDNIDLREPYILLSIRMPREMWQKVNELVEKKVGKDMSATTRALIEGGIWLFEIKKTLNDPEKMKKNIEEYNKRLEEKNSSRWFAQLSDQQLLGLKMAYELEREKRAKKPHKLASKMAKF